MYYSKHLYFVQCFLYIFFLPLLINIKVLYNPAVFLRMTGFNAIYSYSLIWLEFLYGEVLAHSLFWEGYDFCRYVLPSVNARWCRIVGMFLVFETEGSKAFGYNLVFVVNLFHDFWLAFERSLSGVPKKKKKSCHRKLCFGWQDVWESRRSIQQLQSVVRIVFKGDKYSLGFLVKVILSSVAEKILWTFSMSLYLQGTRGDPEGCCDATVVPVKADEFVQHN